MANETDTACWLFISICIECGLVRVNFVVHKDNIYYKWLQFMQSAMSTTNLFHMIESFNEPQTQNHTQFTQFH